MNTQEYLFEKEPIRRAVLRLIIPTICSNVVMIIYSLADTFFVGFLQSSVESAAVSLCSPVLLSFNVVNNLFGVGASSLFSRALGRKDKEQAHQASAVGFWGALVCGILFALLSFILLEQIVLLLGTTPEALESTSLYFFYAVVCGAPFSILNVVLAFLVRAEGRSFQASIGTMSGAFLNILLDPLFIFVFGMGAQGAALATFLSNGFAVAYFLVLLGRLKGKSDVSLSAKNFTWAKAVWSPIVIVGLPAAIQNLFNVLSQVLLNNVAAGYGTDALAAAGIAFRIAQVLIYVSIGITQGIMPLIGYTYSAQLFARMKNSIRFTFKLAFFSIGGLAIVMMLFSNAIMEFFIQIPVVVELGSVLLKGMALAIPFLGIDFIGVITFQACGNGLIALWIAIFRKILCEIPFLYLLNALFGFFGIGFAQLASEILTSALSIFLMLRFLKTLPNTDQPVSQAVQS